MQANNRRPVRPRPDRDNPNVVHLTTTDLLRIVVPLGALIAAGLINNHARLSALEVRVEALQKLVAPGRPNEEHVADTGGPR